MKKWKAEINGITRWFKDGVLHREDGPAHIAKDGSSAWYFDGYFHRDNGPAIESANGQKEIK